MLTKDSLNCSGVTVRNGLNTMLETRNNEKHTILKVSTILVQIIGLFFLVTSLLMFVKHRLLQRRDNTYYVCMLISIVMFLLCDWTVLGEEYIRCDIFSMASLLFGSVSTMSSFGIAWDRFRRMSRLFDSSQTLSQYVLGTLIVWVLSLSTIALPLYDYFHAAEGRLEDSDDTLCFFKYGVLHSGFGQSLYFFIASVFSPTAGMLVCYIAIFKTVKSARISRWINQASVEAGKKTVLIKTGDRRANIVGIPSSQPEIQQSDTSACQSNAKSAQAFSKEAMSFTAQEKSILSKGLLSVFLALLWLPFSVLWLVTTISDSQSVNANQFEWLMLLTKVSSVLQIPNYIFLNTKFRHLYLATVFHHRKNRINVTNQRRSSNAGTGLFGINCPRTSEEGKEKYHNCLEANLETIREISTVPTQHSQSELANQK